MTVFQYKFGGRKVLLIYFLYFLHSTRLSFQVLEIQSISVKAGKTPLPAVWALETTLDVNSDFQGVRYYVKNQEDCLKHFGVSLLDSPVCHLQSERSWTESKIVSTHVISSMCGVVNQNKSNDYAQLKQRFISREAINFLTVLTLSRYFTTVHRPR